MTYPDLSVVVGRITLFSSLFFFFTLNLFSASIQCEAVDQKDVTAIISTVKRALKDYGTPAFKKMVLNCMAQDLSWEVN